MGKWWSKEASPSVSEKEIVEINGNGNTVMTTHLQHLENISIACSIFLLRLLAIHCQFKVHLTLVTDKV